MIKKKAKSKKSAKKAAKKRAPAKKAKETQVAEVRKEVSAMVHEEATEMAAAVINQGKTGQLATVKYLFEMSGVFPASTEPAEGSAREDSLAETLLHRLNIPIEPVKLDEDEEPIDIDKPFANNSDEDEDDEGVDDDKVDASACGGDDLSANTRTGDGVSKDPGEEQKA